MILGDSVNTEYDSLEMMSEKKITDKKKPIKWPSVIINLLLFGAAIYFR